MLLANIPCYVAVVFQLGGITYSADAVCYIYKEFTKVLFLWIQQE